MTTDPAAAARRRLMAVGCALVLPGLHGARAQVPGPAPDIHGILERGALRVVLPAFDVPPFVRQGANGPEGSDVDIARGIARALDVRLDLRREARTFNEVVDIVRRGDADLGLGKISRTLPRARSVRFSRPYARSRHAVLLNRVAFARLAQGRDFKGVLRRFEGSLGVIQGSSFAQQATRSFPHAKLTPFADWDRLIAALVRGEVTAAYRDEAEIRRLLERSPSLALTLRVVAFTDLEDTLSVVLPWNSEQLLALVDLFIAQQVQVRISVDRDRRFRDRDRRIRHRDRRIRDRDRGPS